MIVRDRPEDAETALRALLAGNGVTEDLIGGTTAIPTLLGPPDVIAARLLPYLRLGFDTVIVRLPAPYDAETISRLGEVRAALDARGPLDDRPTRASRLTVVVLAGGVGGAKLAHGVQALVGADLSVVVNTGDDLERHGLLVCPDHDTVLYNLAGLDDRIQGWGVRDETYATADQLSAYGEESWFRLGDRDLAAHIVRTARLRAGARPTEVALGLQRSLGLSARILPMTDEDVRTEVRTDDGWLEFQEYFVHRHQAPEVHEVRFTGVDRATPTPEVLDALSEATVVAIAPSNPIVSVGPILAVPGMRDALASDSGSAASRWWPCPGSSAAARSRARRTGCSSRSATSRARSASPGSTPDCSTGSSSTPSTPTLARPSRPSACARSSPIRS